MTNNAMMQGRNSRGGRARDLDGTRESIVLHGTSRVERIRELDRTRESIELEKDQQSRKV